MVCVVSNVPAFNLTEQFPQIRDEVNAAVLEVLASGKYIGGTAIESFEQDFARYVGTEFCVACNSGTDALYLALRALGVGPGDEVIVPPFTFIATTETVSAVGAVPVFVDVDAETFNLDLDAVERAIGPRTKAIIPVHLFGQPVNMDRLMTIARASNLWVIEDCAQATGAKWGDRRVGSIGHVGCFSFYPTKNLGACGDGGAMTVNDPQLAADLRMLREHGQRQRYYHEVIGVNSRLDAIQAVILQIKLRSLDRWNQQRTAIAQRYQQGLAGLPGLRLPQAIAGGTSVWNQYTIQVGEGSAGPELRDRLRQALQDRGVGTAVYYPLPLHLQAVYANLGYQPGSLPVSEQLGHCVLSLPMFPELTPEQQDRVINNLREVLAAVPLPTNCVGV
ncbi:DegT/DnrJ/EryC1/StrS family aminotransferase [Limnothrix redekei]|uniref:DegT/DnrJ/EryC1/StrS family aminotransferase n=1 Tax=Limnothrix redekei TaxID=132606 RepID=UPI003718AE54